MLVQQQKIMLVVSNINDRVVFGEAPNRKQQTFDIVSIILAETPKDLFVWKIPVNRNDISKSVSYCQNIHHQSQNCISEELIVLNNPVW